MPLAVRHSREGFVTPMRHKSRLDRIDRRIDPPLRSGDACRCAKPVYVIAHPGEPAPGPTTCPTCGGVRPSIVVHYVYRDVWEAL
jgi:hypothetical protein